MTRYTHTTVVAFALFALAVAGILALIVYDVGSAVTHAIP